MTARRTQLSLYLIFALSGSTGLIYESVWSQYLKLFLGHAAYAQCLVLIIFMGGMALGAWLVSKLGAKLKNLLYTYAIVEGIIGLLALAFHHIYTFISGYSFDIVIPALASMVAINIYKISIASLLILPQSILLGATFPLMSGGVLRNFPDTPGKSISLLYFSNSIGAAIAVLVSSFYLIGKLGLPGTILTAGLINIFLAITVYSLVKGQSSSIPAPLKSPARSWQLLLLGASLLTGMASFIYEIAWIRMLSMVLGASTHSFELMLSAFITGLGIGGYWINRKIDHFKDPVLIVAIVQVLMGLFAISTLFLYNYSFEIMAYFMAALSETEQGYELFSLASHSIALLVMLPTTICAGMTLPLFTFILIRKGGGEKSIGQIYSSNTIGAILGVILAVFIGMPVLGLKGSVLGGAVIDICLGLVLLGSGASLLKRKSLVYAVAIVSIVLLVASSSIHFDARKMASGVFRHGIAELDSKSEVLFHEDGRTASVSVSSWDNKVLTISTNGKPDAAMSIDPDSAPADDESTMTLLAALPLSIYPQAKTIANIGLGSGMTAHVALASPEIRHIDTIEIEEAIVRGARFFGRRTERIFNDPRSQIRIGDAKTFFSTYQASYDIIISEPSNPWVSGVSSLFTREFYSTAGKHLNKNGLFVQWLHIYEFNIDLLITVLKAISTQFPYYSIYFADEGNLILIAGNDREVGVPVEEIFSSVEMTQHLSTIHINKLEDIRIRFLGNQDLYQPFVELFETPSNSDYYPYLDLNATRARYMKEDVKDLLDLRLSTVPVLDILYDRRGYRTDNISPTQYFPSDGAKNAFNIYEYFSKKVFNKDAIIAIAGINYLQSAATNCNQQYNDVVWTDSLFYLLSSTVTYLTPDQLGRMVDSITPGCSNPGSRPHLKWLALYRAFVDKNSDELIDSTSQLLSTGSYYDTEQKEFLLITLFTALVKTENHAGARQVWDTELKQMYLSRDLPLSIQILLARVKP